MENASRGVILDYKISSDADALSIVFGYLLLLGREPENDIVIKNALQTRRSIGQLRSDIMRSKEMETILKGWMIETYLQSRYNDGLMADLSKSERTDRIVVLQTSDDNRYRNMLECSSKYNKIFADYHKLDYQKFIGIKRGLYPHHAAFNRIHILKEMMDSGFTGWVLYIDADAVVVKPYFAIDQYLNNLKLAGKMMLLHSVQRPDAPNYSWWNVNDGCFAIDLGSGRARSLIKAWSGIYTDLYSIKEYQSASRWDSIIDDQSSLWLILRIFELKDYVELADLQGKNGFVRQVLRSGSSVISSDEELAARCKALKAFGQNAYDVDAFRSFL